MHIIERFCLKHKISQTELASKVGVDDSYVSHIKKHRKIPSVSIALLFERATNGEISAIELLGLERNSTPE
jgi:transcriptional regulator with XRE-family HTH domain